MNTRFPVLSFLALAFRVIGWLVVIIAPLILIDAASRGHSAGPLAGFDYPYMAAGCISLTILAIGGIALGELAGVLMAIESNTRRRDGREQEPLERHLGLPT